MANLHAFTSALTREQINGGALEDQHIMETDRSAVETAGYQQSIKSEKEKQSLGRALLVLFQASRTTLRKAMVDPEGESKAYTVVTVKTLLLTPTWLPMLCEALSVTWNL
ncbi:hypothetical protein EC968_004065 [Mortierella alpina]|nr:hypothetical protein EC968_004065 [Mortierella alpina]